MAPAAHRDVNVHHYVHHYHKEEKEDKPPSPPPPPDITPDPPKELPEPQENTDPAPSCRQLNGDFVDSYDSTPVVVSQTGCDVTAKWGPALTLYGKIEGDTITLDYEGWGNPTGKITDGLVTWSTANYWTWTKESAAQDAMQQAGGDQPPEAPVPAKPCNPRRLSK